MDNVKFPFLVLRNAQDLLFERQKTIKSMELKAEAQNIQVSF